MDSALIPGIGHPNDKLQLCRLDFQGLGLSAPEMFMASRLVGGPRTAEDLLAGTGLPTPAAVAHLANLISTGVVQRFVDGVAPTKRGEVPADFVVDPQAPDLSPERQWEIAQLLDRAETGEPRVLLGVTATAGAQEIKTAYLRLSQRYHPDQFFRKRLGSYKGKVDQVFNQLTEAFQELSRPVEAKPAAPPPPVEEEDEDETPEERIARSEAALGPIDRMKQQLFRGALDEAQESFAEAEFVDPDHLELPKLRQELKRRRDEITAVEEYHRGVEADKRSDHYSAYRYYSLAASLDPRNPTYVERAARSLMYQGEYKEAKRLAERAVELNPNDPETHTTLGNVFLKAGLEKNARREFERVLELSPKHPFAKTQLRKLRWKF